MTSKLSVKASYGYSKSDPPSRHKNNLVNEGRFYCPLPSERSLDHPSGPSMESIEEEMARVCGEGVDNSVRLKDSSKSSHSHLPMSTVQPDSCATKKCASGGMQHVPSDVESVGQCNKELSSVVNWHLLRLKNESELQKKMKRLEEEGGAEKRARLEKRFLALFGPDELTVCSPNANASEKKEKDIIAALTVKHLMPMYKKQKIASKELFKKLAKHISNKLMEKIKSPGIKLYLVYCKQFLNSCYIIFLCIFAEEKDVQAIVQEYFQNGKCVSTETDIH